MKVGVAVGVKVKVKVGVTVGEKVLVGVGVQVGAGVVQGGSPVLGSISPAASATSFTSVPL